MSSGGRFASGIERLIGFSVRVRLAAAVAVAAGCQESIAASGFSRVKRGMSRCLSISLGLTHL
jgi:hypothetical protein